MTLSELSIRRPVFAWMLMVFLIVFGAIGFMRLGVSQMPDIDFPVVSVAITLQGAAPEVMESQVVDPAEDAIMGIQGIRNVTSNSSQGAASIAVEFDLDRNVDVAVQEVETRIAQAKKLMPIDIDPPVIKKTNPEDQPILWLTLTAVKPTPLYLQMIYARNTLFDQFSVLEGVGDISLGGYVDPNLRDWVKIDELNKHQITAVDVIKAIETEHVELPAGRFENPTNEANARLFGEAYSPEEFGKIFVNFHGMRPNYRPIQLKQLGRIEEGLADIRKISRYSGKPTVGLGILKQHGSNAVAVAKLVREKVAYVRTTLPDNYALDVRVDNTVFIQESVDELNLTLLFSAILTSLVCYLFLGNWSSTINVFLAIPTSIMGAFVALYFFGFTLNTFTLLGLSLAIGIVVDDAIMMLENIVRHVEMGKSRMLGALVGSQEITFAALAATIAIVAIFLPVVFMKGIIGKFLFQYGITVTVAVLLSLLEALTLTPMRCSRFLKTSEHNTGWIAKKMDRLMLWTERVYARSLKVLLRHRWKTLLAAVAFFAFSLLTAKKIPGELVPPQDMSRMLLRFKAPVGSAIEFTDAKIKLAEKYIYSLPEVEGAFTVVGSMSADTVNEGIMFVSLVPANKRKITQQQAMEKVRPALKKLLGDTQVYVQDLSLRGFTATRGFPIEFTIQGADWDKLGGLAQKYMDRMRESGLAADINTDYQIGMPEIQLTPNRDAAAIRGVNLADIGQTVNALIGGTIMDSNTRYPKDAHRYDIRVRLESNERSRSDDIKKLMIRNNYGELVPLSELVTIREKPTPQTIMRLNRERAITIYANPAKGHSQDEALKAVEKIGAEILPEGYHLVMTGSAQTFKESFQSLLFAMLLGIVVSYMVLASQFNSFIHPVTVLMALPFSISGAFIALFLSHQSLNMFSVIGLILLMGIVKKNSILLVDFTNQLRAEGLSMYDALLKAGPVRLRPILMTSFATIAGAVPEALAIGPGAETRMPMAWALIGGVLVSTVLTLFVVPCVYSLLNRFERATPTDAIEHHPGAHNPPPPPAGNPQPV